MLTRVFSPVKVLCDRPLVSDFDTWFCCSIVDEGVSDFDVQVWSCCSNSNFVVEGINSLCLILILGLVYLKKMS